METAYHRPEHSTHCRYGDILFRRELNLWILWSHFHLKNRTENSLEQKLLQVEF